MRSGSGWFVRSRRWLRGTRGNLLQTDRQARCSANGGLIWRLGKELPNPRHRRQNQRRTHGALPRTEISCEQWQQPTSQVMCPHTHGPLHLRQNSLPTNGLQCDRRTQTVSDGGEETLTCPDNAPLSPQVCAPWPDPSARDCTGAVHSPTANCADVTKPTTVDLPLKWGGRSTGKAAQLSRGRQREAVTDPAPRKMAFASLPRRARVTGALATVRP